MKCYSGTCYGGPWHGKKLAHTHTRYHIAVMRFPEGVHLEAEVDPKDYIVRATYQYVGGAKAGAWHYDDR